MDIELDYKESWALKNWCFWTVVLEKTLESPLDCREIQPVNPKGNQSWIIHWKDWSWSSNTLATCCKELTHWKRAWCWERLKVWGEGDDRGWDGWMASPTQWTWVWVNSGSWWCHPTTSFSVVPFSSYLQSFPASRSFLRCQFFASHGQNIGVSDLASVLPVNIQDWFPLGLTGYITL